MEGHRDGDRRPDAGFADADADAARGGGPAGRRVGFARWRSRLPSGGNRYDHEIATALPSLRIDLREYAVTGPWPLPTDRDRKRFAATLAAERDWLVDNIVGSAAPDAIAAATVAGRRVTLLVHYFPADDPALPPADRERLAAAEEEAVRAASAVVVTSRWAADEVSTRYGRGDAVVAVPGVEPAPLAPGSARAGRPPMLLWLGRLTPTKDPLTLVEALAGLKDLRWTVQLVGPDTVDAGLTARVRARIADAGLAGRVVAPGPREGAALERVWADADLLVHTSRAETYGMVVSEALARGVPAVVASGTGAVEAAQGVGATVPPGDAGALSDALRGWLTDPHLRERWRADAAAARPHVPTWLTTASIVATTLLR